MYKVSGTSSSVVKGVALPKVTTASTHHKAHCLPSSNPQALRPGSPSLTTKHFEVAGQHEPTSGNLMAQHKNYAMAGMGTQETSISKELGK